MRDAAQAEPVGVGPVLYAGGVPFNEHGAAAPGVRDVVEAAEDDEGVSLPGGSDVALGAVSHQTA